MTSMVRTSLFSSTFRWWCTYRFLWTPFTNPGGALAAIAATDKVDRNTTHLFHILRSSLIQSNHPNVLFGIVMPRIAVVSVGLHCVGWMEL